MAAGRRELKILAIYDVTETWLLRENLSQGERIEAISQVAGGLAHEMANIFGVIRLSVDGASIRGPEGTGDAFRSISTACDRGGRLAERMLKLTQDSVWAGGATDAGTAFGAAVELSRQALPPGIELDWQAPDQPLPVACDPVDLELAFMNLVLNARNAIAESFRPVGRIEARVDRTGDMAVLVIRDDGPGMPEAVLRRATEPFFTTRREGGGTGLGLAIIEGLARRIGGRFELASDPGEGVTARLHLPIGEGDGTVTHAQELEPLSLEGLAIVLVEDDEEFQTVLGDTLAALGAQVRRAGSAPGAMALLADEPADLLLTDIFLTGRATGLDLAVEAVALRPELRVVYMTGYMEHLTETHPPVPGLLLRKPVQIGQLTHTIRLAVRARQRPGRA